MKKLLAKYCTKENIAILIIMVFYTSLMLMPITFTNSSDEYTHNSRIEDLHNQLLQAENKEEAVAVNVLIKMENNKWEEIQASPAYHFRCLFSYWCCGIFVISSLMLPFSIEYISS